MLRYIMDTKEALLLIIGVGRSGHDVVAMLALLPKEAVT
jgi:hypothetical protein